MIARACEQGYNIRMEIKHFESLYPGLVRDKEINKIVSFIQEGNSSQVIGLSGVGRSTLLGFLAYNHHVHLRHFPKHHEIVHFVMINFSEVKNRSQTEVIKFILLCIVTSLRERNKVEEYGVVDKLFKDSLQYNDELVLTQGLKTIIDYLCLEKKMTVVFLFDRFEEYIPQVTSDFFIMLRSLRDRAKYRFSVVFSLSRPLEDTLEKSILADFSDFIVGHTTYLSLYDEPSVTFRISYLEKLTGKILTKEQKDQIISLTQGHMRLLKTCVEAFLAEEQKNVDLQEVFLSQKTVTGALFSIWNSLTPAERSVLKGKVASAEVTLYLENIGLINEEKIQIPLLGAFIRDEKELQIEEKILFDEVTNSIKRGDVVISDTLTKAEFKLLQYLVTNPTRVIERDEIIATVWHDDKSTLGVTEQAVDQLIFRLRRKIEIDPNNPKHIVTVKSRGITFTP